MVRWISVHLTKEQLAHADRVAKQKLDYVERKNVPNQLMPEADGRKLRPRILSQRCELACAVGLGKLWIGERRFASPADVGRNIEVRGCWSSKEYGLKVYPPKPGQRHGRDDKRYVVMVIAGDTPVSEQDFILAGWVLGIEGRAYPKKDFGRGESSAAHFVPRYELRPMHDLPEDA